jgi:hypothetical protein
VSPMLRCSEAFASLVPFPSLINTILKRLVYQMVSRRPVESTPLIRHVPLICVMRAKPKEKPTHPMSPGD